jgi:hypothetical protein
VTLADWSRNHNTGGSTIPYLQTIGAHLITTVSVQSVVGFRSLTAVQSSTRDAAPRKVDGDWVQNGYFIVLADDAEEPFKDYHP